MLFQVADKRRDKLEAEARRKDAEKQKLKQKFDTANAILEINKLNDPDHVTSLAAPLDFCRLLILAFEFKQSMPLHTHRERERE